MKDLNGMMKMKIKEFVCKACGCLNNFVEYPADPITKFPCYRCGNLIETGN
jgi:hypothetical protein